MPRHKRENTFKFQTFAERIANINIDVLHSFRADRRIQPEDSETFFFETLRKWREVNCSDSFDSLSRRLDGKNAEILAQLVLRKEELVTVLLENLEEANVYSLQATLELVVALSKDLQSEFYEYFPSFFKILTRLLRLRDSDCVEWAFSCLMHLFKSLWRLLVKDIHKTYDLYFPLLGGDQPTHVRDFAAESFAFLVRKLKSQQEFVKFVFETLANHPDGAAGVGKLLFEAIRSVQQQFHSSHCAFLQLLLDSLCDSNVLSKAALTDSLGHLFTYIAQHTNAVHCEKIWTVLLDNFTVKFKDLQSPPSSSELDILVYLLSFLGQLAHYKQGSLVANPITIVEKICNVLQSEVVSCDVYSAAMSIAIDLLKSQSVQLSAEHSCRITKLVFACPFPIVGLDFVRRLLRWTNFEAYVLPNLLLFCYGLINSSKENIEDVLLLLAELVLSRSPLANCGNDLSVWKPYVLEFSFAVQRDRNAEKQSPADVIVRMLHDVKVEDTVDELFTQTICGLVCLPSIRPTHKDSVRELTAFVDTLIMWLQKHVVSINEHGKRPENVFVMPRKRRSNAVTQSLDEEMNPCDDMEKEAENLEISRVLMLVCIALESLWRCDKDVLNSSDDLLDKVLSSVLPFAKDGQTYCSYVLRSLDIILSARWLSSGESNFSEELLDRVFSSISHHLSSPYHQVRMLTLHILSLFPMKLAPLPNGELPPTVFQVCLAAEMTPVDVAHYRERLKHLRKLDHRSASQCLPNDGKFNHVPLAYLLSVPYINFTLMWEPSLELIASHAHGLPGTEFWSYFGFALNSAARNATTMKLAEKQNNTEIQSTVISKVERTVKGLPEYPDALTFRLQLWKAMEQFVDLSEQKNRHVVSLFLQFMEKEYLQGGDTANIMCDMRRDSDSEVSTNEASSDVVSDNESEDEDTDDEDEATKMGQVRGRQVKKGRKTIIKTLCAHLSLLSKFRSLRSCYRSADLHSTLMDLLHSSVEDIQRHALECLAAFKYDYLTPYCDNLNNIVSEKDFRDAIVAFQIDPVSGMIAADHRKDLMPVLLRILFGKMQSRAGVKTGGKAHVGMRRSLVIRCLAGCVGDELQTFLELAFGVHGLLVKDETLTAVMKVVDETDMSHCLHPRKINSSFQLLGLFFSKMGSLIPSSLPYLLKLLLTLTATVTTLLRDRTLLSGFYLGSLRKLRNLALQRIIQFFTCFEEYTWSADEVEALFEAVVWPLLEKLPQEGVYSPTGLLRLFIVWSEKPQFTILLAKHSKDNIEMTPLPYIMQLLIADQTHSTVQQAILGMVDNLISEDTDVKSMEHDGEQVGIPSIQCHHTLPLGKSNVKLLLPHLHLLLEYLQNVVTVSSGNKGLTVAKPMEILSKLAVFVKDPVTSASLLEVLLPLLVNWGNQGGTEATKHLMLTMERLVGRADEVTHLFRLLAPLFSVLHGRVLRTALCSLLLVVGKRIGGSAKAIAQYVTELNAWDTKRAEEPDFDVRLKAFSKVNVFWKRKNFDTDMALFATHCCFHFCRTIDDMALRNSSIHCLQLLSAAVAEHHKVNPAEADIVLKAALFPLLRKGLRNKKEIVRHDMFVLLRSLIQNCSSFNGTMKDLSKLVDSSNPDIDFFENIRHLQIHQRIKALTRLTKQLQDNSRMLQSSSLTQFVLPIVSGFLLHEDYSKHHLLIDAAIPATGAICHCLSWYEYDMILRYYLQTLENKQEFQRQSVRIVVSILEAFHFDLSRAEVVQMETESETVAGKCTDVEMDVDKTDKDRDFKETGVELDAVINTEEEGSKEKAANAQLTVSQATKIRLSVTKHLLPRLLRSLTQKNDNNSLHKVNKHEFVADKEVARIPIALALVKLLSLLPADIQQEYISSILLRISGFLKSRHEDIRDTARKTLQSVMVTLGSSHLPQLLSELQALLSRGFHAHVLSFTVHSVLLALSEAELLAPDSLDVCLTDLLLLIEADIFGALAEEKETEAADKSRLRKTKEARSSKAKDLLRIVSQYISGKCLVDLVMPFKEVLQSTHSHKTIVKVMGCMEQIASGLSHNNGTSPESLLKFVYGLVSESIPSLVPNTTAPLPKSKYLEQPTDCRLLTPAPARGGHMPKTSAKANFHILAEFGFQLLLMLLNNGSLKFQEKSENPKKNVIDPVNHSYMIDPVMPYVIDALEAPHIKLTTFALQILRKLFRVKLPSVQENAKQIAVSIFSILHKHAGHGQEAADVSSLVTAAFKAITAYIREASLPSITEDQLRVLVLRIEEDMHDTFRQVTTFGLLWVILARNHTIPELTEVMMKVAKLSITCHSEEIRKQARIVFGKFLMEYPLGKELKKHLSFFCQQLGYEDETGRLSALQMMMLIMTDFPDKILTKHAAMLFTFLAMRLVNDESPSCRKEVASCLAKLLSRITSGMRDQLFSMTLAWLEDTKMDIQRLSAQIMGIFVETEKVAFKNRLKSVVPALVLLAGEQKSSTAAGNNKICQGDHMLFQVMQLLQKMCRELPSSLKEDVVAENMNKIWSSIHFHLLHPHMWIRLAACQLIGHLLAMHSQEEVVKVLSGKQAVSSGNYLLSGGSERLQKLTHYLCCQLKPRETDLQLGQQIAKNLVYMAKCLISANLIDDTTEREDDSSSEEEDTNENVPPRRKFSFAWLWGRLRREITLEVAKTPWNVVKRTVVFQWIAAVVPQLQEDDLKRLLPSIVSPLVRELSDSGANAELVSLAEEVSKMLEDTTGQEQYVQGHSEAQSLLTKKRRDRKVQKKQELVLNPALGVKKKLSRQMAKVRKNKTVKRLKSKVKQKKPVKHRKKM